MVGGNKRDSRKKQRVPSRQSKSKKKSSKRARPNTAKKASVNKQGEVHVAPPELTSQWTCLGTKWLLPQQHARDRGKPTVVVDLDETIVFGRNGPILVRPGAQALLARLKKKCELVFWTAADAMHATNVYNRVDPDGSAVRFVISRNWTWSSLDKGRPQVGPKDLRLLGRPLHRTLLIEDSPSSVVLLPRSALLVGPYSGEPGDTTLTKVLKVLEDTLAQLPQCKCPEGIEDESRCRHFGDLVANHPNVTLLKLTNGVERMIAATLDVWDPKKATQKS